MNILVGNRDALVYDLLRSSELVDGWVSNTHELEMLLDSVPVSECYFIITDLDFHLMVIDMPPKNVVYLYDDHPPEFESQSFLVSCEKLRIPEYRDRFLSAIIEAAHD